MSSAPRRPGPRAASAVAGAVCLIAAAACSGGGATPAPRSPTSSPSAVNRSPSSSAPASSSSGPATSTAAPASPAQSASVSAGSSAPSSPTTGTGLAGSDWPGYHADQARIGAVPAVPSLNPATVAWSADLGSAVYGQPVVAGGRIIAATEQNRVVALDPATGATIWSVSLGRPLTDVDSIAGCGNVDPLGITSTPVVDLATGTVYVVGEIDDGNGAVHHQLEGLRIATGAVTLSEDVDPPLPAGEQAVHLLQRAALALGNGRVYISYGGNSGDCGVYQGWVVGVAETGAPRTVSFDAAPDGQGGAIWESGGAPALDAAGNLYVTTGNANPDPPQGGPDPLRYTESVVELTPELTPVATFKDTIAGGDEDLATGNPVLLPDGRVFAVGKTDVGYLLSRPGLKEVARIAGICGSDPDGGPAYDRTTDTLFVPCKDGGIQEVDPGRARLGPRLPGANGAPILIGTDLWATGYPEGTLTEFDALTGEQLQTLQLPSTIPHFASPSTGLGLLLVGTDHGVTALH